MEGDAPETMGDEELRPFRNYASHTGGRLYVRRYGGNTSAALVIARVDDWVIELEGGALGAFITAPYESRDGFFFKLHQKTPLHGLFGILFGSKDVDVGDPNLREKWSVESSDPARVKRLFEDDEFREVLFALWDESARTLRLDSLNAQPVRGASETSAKISIVWPFEGDPILRHQLVALLLQKLAVPASVTDEDLLPHDDGWEPLDQTHMT